MQSWTDLKNIFLLIPLKNFQWSVRFFQIVQWIYKMRIFNTKSQFLGDYIISLVFEKWVITIYIIFVMHKPKYYLFFNQRINLNWNASGEDQKPQSLDIFWRSPSKTHEIYRTRIIFLNSRSLSWCEKWFHMKNYYCLKR